MYHTFLPLVPKEFLSVANIEQTVTEEPFLLTAILTVASMDRPEIYYVHEGLWNHMQKLMMDVILGRPVAQRVGCVEGLLILAEWVPHVHHKDDSPSTASSEIPQGSEDTTAWSILGLAVRQGYLLRLDRTSFRVKVRGEPKQVADRKRLAWTCKYSVVYRKPFLIVVSCLLI